MSEKLFNAARANLGHSQGILDRLRSQQPQMQSDIAGSTPQVAQPTQPAVELGPIQNESTPLPTPQATQQTSYRGVPVTDQEREQLKKAIFSEVSNREKPVEVSAMTNVAFNRAATQKKSLGDVVNDPNFFQGITNKRYSEVPQGEDAKIMDFVNQEVDKHIKDNAPDGTVGATHFVHITSGDKKGSLVTMTEKEFGKYLAKKDGQRDEYAASLLD